MKSLSLSVLAASGLLATSAQAADADLAALREEIAQMKQTYEQRIAALELRLAAAAAAPAAVAAVAPPSPPPPVASSGFNPEVSLVLSGMYAGTARDPRQDVSAAAGRERRVQGLLPAGGEASPALRSFSLGESELTLAANIDPNFRGKLLLALAADNTLSVEEANIQTLALGNGVGLKAGRFFSGIGYANEQHPHTWDFSNAALPYAAFFGDRLAYDGVQAKWLAPTEMFMEFGVEAGRVQGFPASDGVRNKNGLMSGSLFAHLGGDVGASHSWRAGASVFNTKPREREYEDVDRTGTTVSNRYSGSSTTAVLDFIWKWAPAGNASRQNLKLQGEWFRRREAGSLSYNTGGAAGAFAASASDRYSATQSGGYAQAVFQFMPRWRLGYRYDALAAANTRIGLIDNGTLGAADLPLLRGYAPRRHTAMIDWSPSEFSRIRLQLAQDRTRPETTDNQIWLHYIVSLGAHGAHSF